jgi:hypothetical protein
LRGTKDHVTTVPCTRWVELQGTVDYHIDLAALLGAPTTFRLLNDPGAQVGAQIFEVATSGQTFFDTTNTTGAEAQEGKRIVQAGEPRGVTPLTSHVNAVINEIRAIEPQLRAEGRQVVVVIATDGLPSDDNGMSSELVQQEFVQALRVLQNLPVWLVIRLCTDDEKIGNYYNDLDKMLELPLEVMDDFFGEGAEVYSINKWLNYTLPLHRVREMGYHHRLFDLLDERLLNKDELRQVLIVLFGPEQLAQAPDVHTNWNGFIKVLTQVVNKAGKQYNPNTRRLEPWINIKQLNRTYRKGGFGCFGR